MAGGAEPKVHEVGNFIHQELPKKIGEPWLVDELVTEEEIQTGKQRIHSKRCH